MSKKLLPFLLLATLGLCYLVGVSTGLILPGFGQFLCLSVFLLIFASIRINQVMVPRTLLLLVFVGSAFWFVAISKRADIFQAQFFQANFNQDPYGKESRKFNADLNLLLGLERIDKLNYPIDNLGKVQEFFADQSQAELLVWGDKHLINIAFPPPYNINLNNFSLTAALNSNLLLVSEVPHINLPSAPYPETLKFMAALIKSHGHKKEDLLLQAAAFWRVWHTSIHLAYVRFQLANVLVEQLLAGSAWQEGLYKCAMREYEYAVRYLYGTKHQELLAAVINNQTVLKYLRVSYNGRKLPKKFVKQIKAFNQKVRVKSPAKAVSQSLDVIEWNIKMLRKKGRAKKH